MTSVGQALHEARRAGVDRLDAQLLLAQVLARPRPWLLAHDDAPLEAAAAGAFAELVARRVAGEPLAYLVGEREFHGLAFRVDRRVLVPRPETETLVDWALECAAALDATRSPAVVDLGTGSGAIAVAVARRLAGARVVAIDDDPDALAVAAANAARHGVPIRFVHGSWWQPLEGERFDLALSNPPYVAEADPHLPALAHEPRHALVSGTDGLEDLRRIVEGAPPRLRPGGWLLLEHGATQADAVARLLTEAGFRDVSSRRDLAGLLRCTGGHL